MHKKTFTAKTIFSIWQKTGLVPYNQRAVFDKIHVIQKKKPAKNSPPLPGSCIEHPKVSKK